MGKDKLPKGRRKPAIKATPKKAYRGVVRSIVNDFNRPYPVDSRKTKKGK